MSSLRRFRAGWYLYDWANSAFSTSIVTVFFGPYLTATALAASHNGNLNLGGLEINYASWFAYVVSVSVILQAVFLPLIGAMADATSRKTRLLSAIGIAGASVTCLLGVVSPANGNFLAGGLVFIAANLLFGASIVVYNSMLPYLSDIAERDAISSRGWAVGYLGGGLLLLVHLLMYDSVPSESSSESTIQLILVSTGLWWAIFTVIATHLLPATMGEPSSLRLTHSYRQFLHTIRGMRRVPQTGKFLIAYLLYNDAVQTVIVMAATFASFELGLEMGSITKAILMVQFVAILGSLFFERVAQRTSTKSAIVITLFLWMAVLLAAWGLVTSELHFFLLAAVIAVVMGGTQALSRSLFSQLIPTGKDAEYFALYELSDKGTSWMGTAFFGLALAISGSYRLAILSLLVFFALGCLLLHRVHVNDGIAAAAKVPDDHL